MSVKSRSGYRSDIDGLRGVAVLSVVFFHLGFSVFPGGFVGVDIFFVISGFLITRIIREELQCTGSFSFSHFYVRRIRRLFPALIFTFVLSFAAALFLFSADFFSRLGLSLLSALFSVSNIYFWKSSNYFSPSAEFEPLLHTWSLSIEEQFYLIWPAILYFLLTKYPKYGPSLVLLSFLFVSLALNGLFYEHQEAIFYLLPFRIFEFAIGALLVWGIQYRLNGKYIYEILVGVGLALIGYSIFFFTKDTTFPSYNALFPCVGAAFLIYTDRESRCGKIFDNKFFVRIGLISYSLYLAHWPLLVFYKYYQNTDSLTSEEALTILAISVITAYLMWSFIENPFRSIKKSVDVHDRGNGTQSKSYRFVTCSSLLFIVTAICAFSVYWDAGVKERVHAFSSFAHVAYGGEGYPWEGTSGDLQASRTLIVYGDSHSKQYASAFDEWGQNKHFRIKNIGHPACMALPGVTNVYQGKVHQSCIDMLAKLKMAVQDNEFPVLIAYRYAKTIADWSGKNEVNFKDEKNYSDRLISSLGELRSELGEKRKLIIFGNVPSANLKMGYMDCITRPFSKLHCHEKFLRKEGELSKLAPALQKFSMRQNNTMFVNVYDPLCDSQYCFLVRDRKLYYSDHAHLTVDGAKLVINAFANQISNFIDQ